MFEAARQIQTDGGVDPDFTARIDRLESSLRRSLRQLDTTLALLDRAEEQFRSIKNDDEIARTIINRSNAFFVKGDFDRAGMILEDALELARDPFLVLTVKHNTIDILARSGRAQEAARLLEQTRSLYRDYADPLTTSHQLWVESVVIRESGGNLERARELLMEATNLLVDHGYDTTTAGFELTVLRSREALGDIRRAL
jgi:tetratricopeptide (TPR) repeat protein